MTETVAPHEEHAVLRRLLRTYGKRIIGHHFADTSIPCLTSFHYHPLHQITFGKNSPQQAVAKDRYSPDIARNHGLRHIQHCLIGVCPVGLLVLDKVTDMHTSPKLKFSAQSANLHASASIRRNRAGEKSQFSRPHLS